MVSNKVDQTTIPGKPSETRDMHVVFNGTRRGLTTTQLDQIESFLKSIEDNTPPTRLTTCGVGLADTQVAEIFMRVSPLAMIEAKPEYTPRRHHPAQLQQVLYHNGIVCDLVIIAPRGMFLHRHSDSFYIRSEARKRNIPIKIFYNDEGSDATKENK